jgi:hypothetical protein
VILDLNRPLCNLNGQPSGTTFANLLAAELVSTPEGPAFQFYDWAVSLTTRGSMELTDQELFSLRDWVLTSKTMTILAKVQIARRIDEHLNDEAHRRVFSDAIDRSKLAGESHA